MAEMPRGARLLGPAWALARCLVGYALLARVGILLMGEAGASAFWPAAGFAAVMLLWATHTAAREA